MTSLVSTFTWTDNCCFRWPLVALIPDERQPYRDVGSMLFHSPDNDGEILSGTSMCF